MPNTAEASDRRWLNRREAWDMAVRAQSRLVRCEFVLMTRDEEQ